ncbi:hypothetical protein V5F65_25355 [Xanthobacter aminoxidans]
MPILYAGLDVSLELTSICVITAEGSILKEAKVASDPEAISSMLLALDGAYERIGLEAGPPSQWLFFGLRDAGLPVCCIETCRPRSAPGYSGRWSAGHGQNPSPRHRSAGW